MIAGDTKWTTVRVLSKGNTVKAALFQFWKLSSKKEKTNRKIKKDQNFPDNWHTWNIRDDKFYQRHGEYESWSPHHIRSIFQGTKFKF